MKNPRLLYILPALVLLVLAMIDFIRKDYSYLTAFQALLGLALLILAFTKRRIL
jgi:hypothetical protein